MNERHLSSRGFFSFFAMIAVLTLTILACGVGAGAPAPSAEQPGAAMPTESLLQATPAASVSTAIPAIPERRRLTLEFPPKIPRGRFGCCPLDA